MSPYLRLPVTAAVLALISLPAAAQPPAPDSLTSDETFFESIDVSVVNVDVVVTDKSGRRVTGLGRDDFQLLEDGQPVEVTNFYAVSGEEGAAAAGTATLAGGESAAVPEEQKLYLAVFIDNKNLPAQARNRVLPALERFIATRMRPDDRLMLASYDGDLKIKQAPTKDSAALIAEIQKMAKTNNLGTQSALDRRLVMSQINAGDLSTAAEGPGGGGGGGRISAQKQDTAREEATSMAASIRHLAEKEYVQTRSTLQTMAQLVDSLSGLPGRKVLLYVGGGLSLRPGETLLRTFLNKYPQYGRDLGMGATDAFEQDTSRLFESLAEHANAHRVTFYTLGAASNVSRSSAEWSDFEGYSSEIESLERANSASPLETLASGTGGLAIYDASDPGVLMERMRQDLDSYYSLGYVPRHKADGRTHKIAIVPRDRALKVRHREGFRSQTAAERASSRTLAAMVLGVAQNPLDVAIEFEDETKDAKGNPVLSVLVKFPMAKLVLLPQEHVHEGRIKVFVGARDQEGRTSPVTEVPVPIRIPNDQLLTALGQTASFRVQVAVRQGEQTIAVSVRDELGNADSTITALYTAGTKVAARAGV